LCRAVEISKKCRPIVCQAIAIWAVEHLPLRTIFLRNSRNSRIGEKWRKNQDAKCIPYMNHRKWKTTKHCYTEEKLLFSILKKLFSILKLFLETFSAARNLI
jgi:hypothetical protein